MPEKAHESSGCNQIPVFDRISLNFNHINETLTRLDGHGERTAVALEAIAAQGAIVASHEKRLDSHDAALGEVFQRTRVIELAREHYLGAEGVREQDKAFWDRIKVKMVPYVIAVGGFGLFVLERTGLLDKFLDMLVGTK